MRYQIRYEENLRIVHDRNPSMEELAQHFAEYGYDPLYVYFHGFLKYVVTFQDLAKQTLNFSLDRDFIRQYTATLEKADIEKAFQENLDADRLVYIECGKIVCEVNALIELPLQNAVSKNLMALRYVRIFKNELTVYLKQFKMVLVLSDISVFRFLEGLFPETKFVFADDIETARKILENQDIDLVFDFIYNRKIRKCFQSDIDHTIDLCRILTEFALEKLKYLAKERGIPLFFYKLPRYHDLTCLHPCEEDNFFNRKSLGQLIEDERYLGAFVRSEEEYRFLKRKEYHSSQRLDDGYCFVMDESNNGNMHVHNGIRANGLAEEQGAGICNFFGPCTAYGFLAEDRLTVPSLVQQYAKEDKKSLQTHNRAGIHGDNELNSLMEALAVPVARGDVHIFLDVLEDLPEERYPHFCFVKNWFNDNKSKEEIQFLDFPGHCNSDANKLMARYIYEDVKDICAETVERKEKRTPLLEQEFDCFEWLSMTHSSCVKQLRLIRKLTLGQAGKGIVGAVMIPDHIDIDRCFAYISCCMQESDFLYVFLVNDNIDCVESNRIINKKCTQLDSRQVKAIPLEHFFSAQRYLDSSQCFGNCFQQAVFTEKAFFSVVVSALKINRRFCLDEEKYCLWNQAVEEAESYFHGEIRKIKL